MISFHSRSDLALLTAQRPALKPDIVCDHLLSVPVIVEEWRAPKDCFAKAYHPV